MAIRFPSRLREQAGSAAKSFLFLSVLIAGVVAAYLHYFDAKSRLEEGGAEAVQMKGDLLNAELKGIPAPTGVAYTVNEQIESTSVMIDAGVPNCDPMFLNQVYQTCAMHRVQHFKDGKCKVILRHAAGECSQP